MEFQAAFLCDAASVREGLLFALGAGVSRVFATEYPITIDITLALLIELDEQEVKSKFELEARIVPDGTDAPVARYGGNLQISGAKAANAELHYTVPVVLRMTPVLAAGGLYRTEISVGALKRTLPFWVGSPEAPLVTAAAAHTKRAPQARRQRPKS
jgi:hypothetical protein